jgi:pyruvate,orthophosphate dikinase
MIQKIENGNSYIIDSDALRVNLEETAVEKVSIDPKYLVLRESVQEYRGLLKSVDHLLFELNHPFRNWKVILPELRSFALKNLPTYSRHPKGPEAIELIIDIFFEAILKSGKKVIQQQGIDNLLSFIEKILTNLPNLKTDKIHTIINNSFIRLSEIPDSCLSLLIRGHPPLNRIGKILLARTDMGFDITPFIGLMEKSLRFTYLFWLQFEDPVKWFEREFGSPPTGDLSRALYLYSHDAMKMRIQELDMLSGKDGNIEHLEKLIKMPAHLDIVKGYKELPDLIASLGDGLHQPLMSREPSGVGKILFLFQIMETEALAEIHEETLREINRSLVEMIKEESTETLLEFVGKTFILLKEHVVNYPRTSLQCIQTIGIEIFKRKIPRLVELFLEQIVHFGFQYPCIKGVDTEWQLLYNPSHLLNIRVWLDLISLNPKWCSTLLSALIINIKLGGICIRDTDLFQKEITKLLNSDIEPVYNLVKQLTKLLPVYFNEIGAEGLLRDVSTEVDEIHHRKDILIHFLRKQSHVESSNLIVDFIEEIFRFWLKKKKEGLRQFLPPEIFHRIREEGPFVDPPHRIMKWIDDAILLDRIEKLLELPEGELNSIIDDVEGVDLEEKRRVKLLVQMYRLENQKYKLGFQEILYQFSLAKAHGFTGLERIEEALKRDDVYECLTVILDYLEELKGIILSPERYEAREDIYHKRHIAADIPSMYGRYHEKKFDALGLTFRLENLANLYFERMIDSINLSFITRATFFNIVRCLKLFFRAMQIDGISSQRLETQMQLLESSLLMRQFTFTQYLDILRGFSEGVKDILYVYYTNVHKDNLSLIIKQMGRENILEKYKTPEGVEESFSEFVHRVSERFLRDIISQTFGLQYLDNFITKIHQVLSEQKETLNEKELDLLMSYDPERVVSQIHEPQKRTKDLIHLGSKGYNLVQLAAEGIPIPPGFIITTEVFRCHSIIEGFHHARNDFVRRLRDHISKIEEVTGKEYGNPSNPLLISVRSGAPISMPGMMHTLLNVGINEEIAEGLAKKTGETWFAWDNYRRFLQSWGMSHGMERETFHDIMKKWKAKFGVEKKRQFSGAQMREMALQYKEALIRAKVNLYDDPWEQLQVAIHLVLQSWNSEKARAYREIMDISGDWGTAVIVQAMVFGNLSTNSGSGVLFTANPHKRMRRVVLWGDFTPGNQGEDIVSGLVTTYPISNEQRSLSDRDGEMTLEESFPEIYKFLDTMAKKLIYEKRWNPQEIEFTFEGPRPEDLYILQTRDMVTTKKEIFPVFVHSQKLHENYMTRGTGVSGGALCGRAVFTLNDILKLREEDPGAPLILIRSDTVPDDIKEISMADGLLTAKGGQTSHAAIVALRLNKTCVVGCTGLVLLEDQGKCEINHKEVCMGDFISIDGRNGSVYIGCHPITEQRIIDL